MAASFWPPQVGDVWLSGLDRTIPKSWVCTSPSNLSTGIHDYRAEIIQRDRGPLRLIWRNGEAVTANHVSELGHATVNVEVTDVFGVHIHAGIREITQRPVSLDDEEAELERGILHLQPTMNIRFLTNAEIEHIAYDADEYAAEQKEA